MPTTSQVGFSKGGYDVIVYTNGVGIYAETKYGGVVASGVLGIDDYRVLNAAIAYIIANGAGKVYVDAGTYVLGSNTLSFPATIPIGFEFICSKAAIFNYSGTTDIVNIDSNSACNFEFGILNGNSNGTTVNGIHLQPRNAGVNGQITVVTSRVAANKIATVKNGIYFDCSAGNIANNEFVINIINNSVSVPGGMSSNCTGILVNGSGNNICQGNRIYVTYLHSGANYSGGAVWTGISIGSAAWGATKTNVNRYEIPALDAENVNGCTGVVTYGGSDVFIGNLVDLPAGTGIVLNGGANQNHFVLGSFGGATQLVNNSGNVNNVIISGSFFSVGLSTCRMYNDGQEIQIYSTNVGNVLRILDTDGATQRLSIKGQGYINSNISTTTLNGTTAGSAIYHQLFAGNSLKMFFVYLSGYQNNTGIAQTIPMGTNFSHQAKILVDDSGGATVDNPTTTLTLPINMASAKTGWIVLIGW